MKLETDNRKAFELLAEALSSIDRYKQTKDRELLRDADEKLDEALKKDPKYLRALYNSAIVKDLSGESRKAIEKLEALLQITDVPELNQQASDFNEQAKYQLALAYCHNYDRESLDKATGLFQEIIEKTDSHVLKLLARLGLAQVYSMRIIKPEPGLSELVNAEKYARLYDKEISIVEREFRRLRRTIDEQTRRGIQWAMSNSRALKLMYSTDYLGVGAEKVETLQEALEFLEKAYEYDRNDWANHVDQGSAHMRLGYWLTKVGKKADGQAHFKRALDCFKKVSSSLRPNYGFMYFEMGRTYRLMGIFKDAQDYLQLAKGIDRETRDISDESIDRELQRTQQKSQEFP